MSNEASANSPYSEFNDADWPLCPSCGEDELYAIPTNPEEDAPTIAEIVGCMACHWKPADFFERGDTSQ